MYELSCLYSDHSTLYFYLISVFLHTVLYFIKKWFIVTNFTLPRLFRNPAISNFFPFPLGLRNSGVRLYYWYYDTPLISTGTLNWAGLWVAIAICQNVKYYSIIVIWKLWCSYCYFIKRETSLIKVSVVEFSLFRTMTNYRHLWGSISIWNWRKLNCPWRDGTGEWQNSKVSWMGG